VSDIDELRSRCHNILPGHGKPVSIAASLRDIADSLAGDETGDIYGAGRYLGDFEAELATEFGKEAAVFMPSGTMAQQIALRLWCERTGRSGVAMHPTAHLEIAEYLGYQVLHGLHRIQFGAPEVLHNRLLTLADLEALPEKPGAVLLEVPCRPLGGEIPDWEDLCGISAWARRSGIPIHLDGARIWQRRHGGNLFSQAPYVAAARQGLASCLPQLPAWNKRAGEIAAIINGVPGMRTRPAQPKLNFFQVFLEGEVDALESAHAQLASDTGTFVFSAFRGSSVPGVSMAELHCWRNAMAFDCSELRQFLEKLVAAVK